jgi:hypothetical protein
MCQNTVPGCSHSFISLSSYCNPTRDPHFQDREKASEVSMDWTPNLALLTSGLRPFLVDVKSHEEIIIYALKMISQKGNQNTFFKTLIKKFLLGTS